MEEIRAERTSYQERWYSGKDKWRGGIRRETAVIDAAKEKILKEGTPVNMDHHYDPGGIPYDSKLFLFSCVNVITSQLRYTQAFYAPTTVITIVAPSKEKLAEVAQELSLEERM